MRFAEYTLLLIPLGVVIAWLYGVRGLSLRGVVAVVIVFTLFAGLLYGMGDARMFRGTYVPAHLEGTQIVPGSS
jgi:hypothetical protein